MKKGRWKEREKKEVGGGGRGEREGRKRERERKKKREKRTMFKRLALDDANEAVDPAKQLHVIFQAPSPRRSNRLDRITRRIVYSK